MPAVTARAAGTRGACHTLRGPTGCSGPGVGWLVGAAGAGNATAIVVNARDGWAPVLGWAFQSKRVETVCHGRVGRVGQQTRPARPWHTPHDSLPDSLWTRAG